MARANLGHGNPKGVKRDSAQFEQLEWRRMKAVKLFDQG